MYMIQREVKYIPNSIALQELTTAWMLYLPMQQQEYTALN
jgi:hypothetical protein